MLKAYCLGILLCVAGSLALYDSSSDVVELTPSNFDKLVRNSDDVWLVEFYAPWCGHCKNLVPEYKKTASALKGIMRVGAVDADAHKSLSSDYGVSGFPNIKVFNGGKHTQYHGPRTADSLVEAGLKALKERAFDRLGRKPTSDRVDKSQTDVIELTDSNFQELVLDSEDLWLVEFYAPWCGHCKNLEPEWAKAAAKLKGQVKLGALDSTAHRTTAKQFDVQGYPTIKFFPAGKKSTSSAEDYNGGRSTSDIVNFALDKVADTMPGPEVIQVTSDEILQSCIEKPLCVVSILPHILDCQSACRNDYINILTRHGDKHKRKMWGWVWAEAGAQPALEEALELGGFGYPAMAVINSKKLKFATLRGAFSDEGIGEFLRDLAFGRGQTAPVKGAKIPEAVNTDPWDGKDGELPQEEDIDLSDVDLDDVKKDEL